MCFPFPLAPSSADHVESTSCGANKDAIEYEHLAQNSSAYGYCSRWDDMHMDTCGQCLSTTQGGAYLRNCRCRPTDFYSGQPTYHRSRHECPWWRLSTEASSGADPELRWRCLFLSECDRRGAHGAGRTGVAGPIGAPVTWCNSRRGHRRRGRPPYPCWLLHSHSGQAAQKEVSPAPRGKDEALAHASDGW